MSEVRTNATAEHKKAQSYFYDDAAASIRNECNRAARNGQWDVVECDSCSKENGKRTWHVASLLAGYLCV